MEVDGEVGEDEPQPPANPAESEFKAGLATFAGAAAWPARVVENLCSAGEPSIRNFKRAMLNSIKVTTHYGSNGCVEVVFRMLLVV